VTWLVGQICLQAPATLIVVADMRVPLQPFNGGRSSEHWIAKKLRTNIFVLALETFDLGVIPGVVLKHSTRPALIAHERLDSGLNPSDSEKLRRVRVSGGRNDVLRKIRVWFYATPIELVANDSLIATGERV